jgi:hypothetical protein
MGDHVRNAELKVVNRSDVNRYGDADEEVETRELTGVFEVISGDSAKVDEGRFDGGDLRAFIQKGTEDVEQGNVIVYQNQEYRIMGVVEMEIGHDAHLEARAERV